VDLLITGLSKLLVVLFAVGVVGCAVVIPLTAGQLVVAILEKDPEEEIRGQIVKPERL
jgi:hypothetical protein